MKINQTSYTEDLTSSASAVYAIARIGDDNPSHIAQVLDTGVDGVLVPHVSSADAAHRIVSASRYPPEGDRSLNPYVRATRYGSGPDSGTGAANERTAVMVMIEGQQALANLEAISAVEGVDAIFVGPVDLSAALGKPGQPEHPLVVETIIDVFNRTHASARAAGIYAPNTTAAARWTAAGARLVAFSADIALTSKAFETAVTDINALTADHATAAPTS